MGAPDSGQARSGVRPSGAPAADWVPRPPADSLAASQRAHGYHVLHLAVGLGQRYIQHPAVGGDTVWDPSDSATAVVSPSETFRADVPPRTTTLLLVPLHWTGADLPGEAEPRCLWQAIHGEGIFGVMREWEEEDDDDEEEGGIEEEESCRSSRTVSIATTTASDTSSILSSRSSLDEDMPRSCSYRQSKSSLLALPPEILDQILCYLNYPTLNNFQNTCRLASGFPSAAIVLEARATYVDDLLLREMSDAGFRQVYASQLGRRRRINNIHQDPTERAEILICYTCFSELPRTSFLATQITGTRSYGHKDAGKRFCIPCGLKQGRWVRGTYFKGPQGGLILCFHCEQVKSTSRDARNWKLCQDCFEICESKRRDLAWALVSGRIAADEAARPRGFGVTVQRHTRNAIRQVAQVKKGGAWVSQRHGKCQRCWMQSHTLRSTAAGHRLFCRSCAAENDGRAELVYVC